MVGETSEKMCFETPAQKTQNTKITICTNFDEVLNVLIVYQLQLQCLHLLDKLNNVIIATTPVNFLQAFTSFIYLKVAPF